jgi:hypothetical protein
MWCLEYSEKLLAITLVSTYTTLQQNCSPDNCTLLNIILSELYLNQKLVKFYY